MLGDGSREQGLKQKEKPMSAIEVALEVFEKGKNIHQSEHVM